MNDNTNSRLMAVAALCGLVALIIAWALIKFGFFWSLIIGIVVAIIVWMMGNRSKPEAAIAPSAQAPTAQAAPVASAADPVVETATAEDVATPEPVREQAVPDGDTLASDEAPKVKASAALAGQDDLASRKGEWKYEAPVAEASAPKVKAKATAKPKKPAAKAPAKAKTEKKPKAEAKTKTAARPMAADGRPEALSGPRDGGADDLKQIKGVGPKMQTMLNGMGFYHFDQIAGWRKKEVEWVDANLEGFKGRVSRDDWVKQAKVLAKGGTTEFSKKVKKGGVY